MRFYFLILLSIFASDIGLAQVVNTNESDSTFTLRLTPEGSYTDSILVDYLGVWSVGVEKNKLIPCGSWTPDSLGGTTFTPDRIGLSDGEAVWDLLFKSDTDTALSIPNKPNSSVSDLFIKAKGWLVGPSSFDHFSQNLYTLKTLTFKEVRWAQPEECDK